MAQRTIIELIDDIDGTEGASTRTFALDGVTYEIELAPKNDKKLRTALEPFIKASRKQPRKRAPRRTTT